jgi:RNA polymerase sigma factor (sigma-70 family)
MAMVLGTALSAMGAQALAEPAEGAKAVQDLSRYCTACWRNARLDPDSWGDCTQEVFCRLLERVAPDSWELALKADGDEKREFFRAIDAVKKRNQRTRRFSPLALDVADTRTINDETRQDRLEALRRATGACLTQRQRDIVRMSLEGWTVHEISAKLELSPARVSDEKYKAIQKLRTKLVSEHKT